HRSIDSRVVLVQPDDGLHDPLVLYARVRIEVEHRAAHVARRHAHGWPGLGVAEYQGPANPPILEKRLAVTSLQHDVGSEAPAIEIQTRLAADAGHCRQTDHRHRGLIE